MSNGNYDRLCFSLLNDANTYEPINYDPLPDINNELKIKLDELRDGNHISKNLHKKLFVINNKLGSFRILTKLHKEEFGLRPIVNCRNHPTSNISMLIDIILKNFVKNSESFLLDSQNLIQKLYRSYFPSYCKIYSCDFSSLYTSIDLDDALRVITEFTARNFSSTEISTYGFHILLKIIFTLNYFRFNDKHFKQIFGISMGNIAAPSIANIYLVIKEDSFLVIHRPYILAYYRFIDDIFIIVRNGFDINILKNHFGYLVLNVVGGKTVNFLDLVISLNPLTDKLKFNLYIKPTFTFSYVLPESNHPSFVFKNIAPGVFIRIFRICSELNDFLYHAYIFALEFFKKGYNRDQVMKSLRMVSNLDRDQILPYKPKISSYDYFENVYFKLPFSFNYLNVEKFFQNYNKDSNYFSSFLNNYNVKLIYSMDNNLAKIFIHNFKVNKPFSSKYHHCKKSSCKHCQFANTTPYLKLNNFYLPIMCKSDCRALNVIYIIYCKICPHLYIGQTNCLRNRFNNHKRNILTNILDYDSDINDGKNVVIHFNQKDHNLRKNFGFFIFKNNIQDLGDRLNLENQLQHLCLALNIPLLNDRIADKYLYRKQIYLFK